MNVESELPFTTDLNCTVCGVDLSPFEDNAELYKQVSNLVVTAYYNGHGEALDSILASFRRAPDELDETLELSQEDLCQQQ